jgi:pimeloyl-ACP methyl ester carboxylesterase
MNKPTSTPVDFDSKLTVSYIFEEAQHPQSDSINAQQHGINHGSMMFEGMAEEIRYRGVHTGRIDIESRGHNWISLDEYIAAYDAALRQMQSDTKLKIGSILGHSMGGHMTQELQQAYPEWSEKPTILMAPVPLVGALPAFVRAVMKHPSMLWKSVKKLDIQDVMRTPEDVRTLFFDKETPETIVVQTMNQLRHTSYRAYLSLLTRYLTRPEIERTDTPTLLMHSKTDALFGERYDDLEIDIYTNLTRKSMPGGHDFYIQYPALSAEAVADFHKKHAV